MKRSPLRSRPKPKGTDRELAAAWIKAVVPNGARCLLCGSGQRREGHHVISQQVVRKLCAEARVTLEGVQALLWDPRNGVCLCETCHSRHTTAYRRVPRYLLPAAVYAFVEDLDALFVGREPALHRLRQEYPDL